MELNEVLQRLDRFIRDHFNIPESDPDFDYDVHLFDYGYIDSFGAVELTNFVEEAFLIKINESDLIAYPLNTIREISTFVLSRQKGEV
jgi:D-alanine--poly(phosphoribitol) ligase subunit 2